MTCSLAQPCRKEYSTRTKYIIHDQEERVLGGRGGNPYGACTDYLFMYLLNTLRKFQPYKTVGPFFFLLLCLIGLPLCLGSGFRTYGFTMHATSLDPKNRLAADKRWRDDIIPGNWTRDEIKVVNGEKQKRGRAESMHAVRP